MQLLLMLGLFAGAAFFGDFSGWLLDECKVGYALIIGVLGLCMQVGLAIPLWGQDVRWMMYYLFMF